MDTMLITETRPQLDRWPSSARLWVRTMNANVDVVVVVVFFKVKVR